MSRPLLPDFTRIIWHSESARLLWEPRISAINTAWAYIEKEAVALGVKPACLTMVDPQNLVSTTARAAQHGLIVLPLGMQGVAATYSSTTQIITAGKPWQYRIAITKPSNLERWLTAWGNIGGERMNNAVIGELLGYPACCRAFFERVWANAGGVDTTWEMAADYNEEPSGDTIRVPSSAPLESNILLRWLGVRAVSHLPCSFKCAATTAIGAQHFDLMRATFPNEEAWAREMLSWPIEWSALHGIAEIRTPVLTISTRSTFARTRQIVQRDGDLYPEEGSRGLRFPYLIGKRRVTSAPAFQRSLQPRYALNGFGSAAGMEAAHATLLEVLPSKATSILDLGAGDGSFLEAAQKKGWAVSGVEIDSIRAGAARIPLRRSDLFDVDSWNEDVDVIAFMPGRLVEASTDSRADEVRRAIRSRSHAVLLYAYGDWLQRGGLPQLIVDAGLDGGRVEASVVRDGVQAALVTYRGAHDDRPSNNRNDLRSLRSAHSLPR